MNITGTNNAVWEVEAPIVTTGAFTSTKVSTYNTEAGISPGGGGVQWNFDASRSWSGETSSNGAHTHTVTASAASAGAHTHTLTGSNASAGTHTHTISGTNANNGTHTHTLSGTNANNGAHTHTWSGSIANNGAHTHTITVANNGAHTHTIGNTGGGLPINILPPYQTVYMWRRTA
jgi:hypothetical protein